MADRGTAHGAKHTIAGLIAAGIFSLHSAAGCWQQFGVQIGTEEEYLDEKEGLDRKQPENDLEPNLKSPRTITHPCFEIVSVQEAEIKLSTKPNGSYIIRPTTSDSDKLSITWKLYSNVYRHLRKLWKFSINL